MHAGVFWGSQRWRLPQRTSAFTARSTAGSADRTISRHATTPANGSIRRDRRFGEGEYERSDTIIRKLLAEASAAVGQGAVSIEAGSVEAPADWENLRSPENYVGYERTENFASPGGGHVDRRRAYTAPALLALNQSALVGEWTMGRQATVLNSPLAFTFG